MEAAPLINQSLDMRREGDRKIVITDADKENFFKCLLADKSYEETVSLFDNQLELKFRAMTVQENTDIVNQIGADRNNGAAAENDAYLITIHSYRLGLSLVSVGGKAFSNVTRASYTPLAEGDTYVLARAKVMLGWSTPKLSAFLDAFQLFEAKLLKLTNEVQNPNFWKASA